MPRTTPATARAYLLAYNAAQLAGWSYVLLKTVTAAIAAHRSPLAASSLLATLTGRPTTAAGAAAAAAYASAGPTVRLCQGAALLETVHVLLGLVPGSPALSFLQWFGRSNVLFLILGAIPALHSHWAVVPLFAAWAAADVARYAWYAANLAAPPPPAWLTWLRYSAFIPLYPLGIFAGEMPLIKAGLPHIDAGRLHSYDMPNPLNAAFDYGAFCRLGLYALLPAAFVTLYRYLLAQRARRLGGGGGGGSARTS